MSFRQDLLDLAEQVPFLSHPWFQEVIHHRLKREQIILGEQQHYLRVRRNADIFGPIVTCAAREGDYETFDIARSNFKDEMCGRRSHCDIMYQFLEIEGIGRDAADKVAPTPGTMAAIAMLTNASTSFSALEQLAMLSLAELQYGGAEGVASQMYQALCDYGFSHRAAETYFVHVESDAEHGPAQINYLVQRAEREPALVNRLLEAARYGLIAFKFEWDGHYQAATRNLHWYWNGQSS